MIKPPFDPKEIKPGEFSYFTKRMLRNRFLLIIGYTSVRFFETYIILSEPCFATDHRTTRSIIRPPEGVLLRAPPPSSMSQDTRTFDKRTSPGQVR